MLPKSRIPESMLNMHTPFFRDPAELIRDAMGGRQFFFEIGAKAIHRIGLLRGLGWLLPFGESRDKIDYVRIVAEDDAETFTAQYGSLGPDASHIDFRLIREEKQLALSDLAASYERNTGVEQCPTG